MKNHITLLAKLALLIPLTSSVIAGNEATPDFFELVPGQEYPLSIPEEKKKHFLPYAYLKHELPNLTNVPIGSGYWVNVNKQNNRISHLTLEAPIQDQSQCEDARQQLLGTLYQEGFEAAKPTRVFFDRVAKKGKLAARLSCSLGAIPASAPSRKLPPKVRLTITTLEEHEQFEETMRQVRH